MTELRNTWALREVYFDEHGNPSMHREPAPMTGEPVAWVVMNGLSKYQVCGAKAPADALCSEMQKRHDLSGSLAAFHVQPLYTHPAPGVPDDVVRDAQRLDWLARNPVDALDVFGKSRPDEARFIRATIDAAMTAAQAQKGQP